MRRTTTLCALVLALTACTAQAEPGPVFDDEDKADIACLKHQAAAPGARYSDEGMKRSDEVLSLLRYYTAHGRKPFCDGNGASVEDKAWADLYIRLGADRANVSSIVG
ncbi:hypothetical protein [Umezawaea sp. Da 62-37]|uniref:hypothetical protein n=1 Tax=Umezawaea sp. Da 62-37 TaxID=3075927 RepID=UPI0028F72994|nr:hypothetical protein [Umezawaea sp. Da 62-37]WNV87091.1 hypothetical protein RM788_02010 [Umezawaea sp. Da 62-37]